MPAFELINDLRRRLNSLRKTHDPEAIALASECESLLAIIREELEAVAGERTERSRPTPSASEKSGY